jgi:hypothetical protein
MPQPIPFRSPGASRLEHTLDHFHNISRSNKSRIGNVIDPKCCLMFANA